jgi:hypothetical protein
MNSNNEYEIGIIENETDALLCSRLIVEELALHNPLLAFNQITSEQLFNKRLWPLMMDVLNENSSFFVRHRLINEIVVAIIASDLFLYCEKHPYHSSNAISNNPMEDLFDEMRNRFVYHDLDQKLKPNMVLRIAAGATQSQHSGKGLASKLHQYLCDYARDNKGFQYAFIQTIHPATRHIYINKMNGKEMTTIRPENWLWNKKGNGLLCPFKDYRSGPIVNILLKLK